MLETSVPAPILNAFKVRHSAPKMCIKNSEDYIAKLNAFDKKSDAIPYQIQSLSKNITFSTQLLALCNAQIEQYQQAYQLLSQLLSKQSFSIEQLRTLNLLASEIPERDRPEFNNQLLIKILTTSLRKIESSELNKYPDFKTKLLLSISKLSLENDQLRNANITLEAAKESLEKNQNIQLTAWMDYYYGLYYAKINQQQLAVANLFTANKTADKYNYTKLSGEAKKSIADLYQQKYLFNRAIDFASQRVELYMGTENSIKQVDSLMQLAILKGKKKNTNEALIYLFNALELIQDKKDNILLAQVFLELGRVYSDQVTSKTDQKHRLLAQKYLQNARYHFTRLKDVRHQIESLLLLARLNLINEDPALAILQLEKTLRLASDRYPELSVRAFEMLASSYEITGNHQQAIVHFKNFHALQNRIKEHLFTLQQLQISEQLHLIERTQQKRYLEIENKDLKNENTRFTLISYSSITLLIITILSLFYIFIYNRKLRESEHTLQQQISIHPRTKLPSQQAKGKGFHYVYNEIPLYYALVNIPFLEHLNELSGATAGKKLEKKLGQHLSAAFAQNSDIFQVRDNQILFITEQQNYQQAQFFAQKIELCFLQFTEQHNLPNTITTGIVAFPFLNNVSRAINPTRMLNLTSLALFGANQLRDTYQGSNWVELYAIDNLQPAFFDGDLWILGQKAIQKGIVKINSNYQSHHFHWPEIDS
ncbi:GGDEF domain-containing protein [Psychromonas marina]|uniref:GGDEF domain-containing protein n=1 Tax=Psychromonas marina TaxID=88364 RepID=UPI0024E1769F|nr:GGDEF domain-containing protein [Psychromonas marina]